MPLVFDKNFVAIYFAEGKLFEITSIKDFWIFQEVILQFPDNLGVTLNMMIKTDLNVPNM